MKMKGIILDFDVSNNIGKIRGWNEQIYKFTNSDWKDRQEFPRAGLLVDFEVDSNNAAHDIYCIFKNEIAETENKTPKKKTRTWKPGQIWKFGKFLVMRRGASLPNRCIKTNRPTTSKVTEKLYWLHPGNVWAWAGTIGVFLILLLYPAVVQKESISIGLCEEFLARRRKGIAASSILLKAIFISLMVFIAVMVAGFVGILPRRSDLFLLYFILLFFIPWILFACRLAVKAWLLDLISIVWIEDEYIFIKGVNQEYISEFPEWSDYSNFTLPTETGQYDLWMSIPVFIGILVWILIENFK